MVTVLLEHNGDVNDEQRPDGATPLYWAAQQDKADLVKLLLEHTADPSKGLKTLDGHVGTTPLYWAANKRVRLDSSRRCKPKPSSGR